MAQKRTRRERIAHRLLMLSLLVSLVGAGILVYWMYFRVLELKIAVSNPNGEDAAVLTSINEWMVSEKRRYRLKLVPTGGPDASLEKLRLREVELAALRGDRVQGGGVSSIMVLFNEVAGVVIPANSSVEKWGDLRGKTIGAPRGTAPDDPLLLALLHLNGVSDPKVISLETDDVRLAVERKRVQAIGFVSPGPGYAGRNFHQYFSARSGQPSMLTVDDPDLLAGKDTRFAAASIVAGSLRANPPVPDETVGTLSIGRHLVVRNGTNNFLVANLARTLLDARRALFSAQPLLTQAGAPDLSADAFVKVHDAAKKIYNGDEPSWTDMALEWIYIVPMILGAIGTLMVWLFQRYVHPEYRDLSEVVADLLDIRVEAGEAENEDELFKLKRRTDALTEELNGEAYEYAGMDAMGAVLTAVLIAENQIKERRAELRDPAHALQAGALPGS